MTIPNLVRQESAERPTKWQVIELSSPTGPNASVHLTSELQFNNLEIGKTYKVTAHVFFQESTSTNNDKNCSFNIIHDGNTLISLRHRDAESTDGRGAMGGSRVFTATATTITNTTFLSNSIMTAGNSWIMLEELPNHEEVTDWT